MRRSKVRVRVRARERVMRERGRGEGDCEGDGEGWDLVGRAGEPGESERQVFSKEKRPGIGPFQFFLLFL